MTNPTGYTLEHAFARDVLTIAVNGGINHWARVHGYLIDCPPTDVRAEGIDARDERSLWHLDLDNVQEAITKLATHPEDCFAPDSGIDDTFRSAIPALLPAIQSELATNGYPRARFYADRVDATMADLVVQVAVADEVIY
ncbi:hypothetical protein [Jatrophihabitans lederbergiae]|uniref:Uncharacterized protein n=1 Tax=Jatrophihabitans lederbergiae TaxID=3075547 RepID=A0ABU2JBD2_9ACTN|nr:hypothetical protein [Jatrophihabitans sp. DSM 44399]MDT0262295.1 hypothetical protein [Jatrophihabitans sp. DSM 44399]